MKTVGICIGASTVTLAFLSEDQQQINVEETRSIPHEGNPRGILIDLLKESRIAGSDRIAVTGRKIRHLINASTISEPEALEAAYQHIVMQNATGDGSRFVAKSPEILATGDGSRFVAKTSDILVSAGGETFMVYRLDSHGRIVEVKSGNKCASGTGEFFLQQLKRMDLPVEEAMDIADSDNPYKVAGRCSVFCKSDCTHALNKGASKSNVVAGLCKMMAGKIVELLKNQPESRVYLVGGSSSNRIMVRFLEDEGLDIKVPPHSRCFEALGAAIWALTHETRKVDMKRLFKRGDHGFPQHKPLSTALSRVRFMESVRGEAAAGDVCILGLDVGSTTTKAVLMRKEDQAILAGVYLRTNGDPVGASRKCYKEIASQLKVPVSIVGLGVTGSGRQIAGLHALTPSIINEIIAHARAAAHFDPQVDTLFEIGGQDAKYTYLTNGVASDYAMNEACSAGTGSFLEESALESLNLKVEEIGEMAIKGQAPPNFNDQCAAFIGSDIKTAIQNGLSKSDIAAGLVYSVCLNYLNRVKGNRAVGQKVFMQGGVCYNMAIPAAMANLTDREIIVPPEPGLMGAYGVALETQSMMELGQIEEIDFDLNELSNREVHYEQPFVCNGGKERCDRKCNVSRIRIGEKVYPFGGACNRYYNLLTKKQEANVEELDLVAFRERLLFACAEGGVELMGTDQMGTFLEKNDPRSRGVSSLDPGSRGVSPSPQKTVGLNLSLMVNTLFPLYAIFFKSLGYRVVYPAVADSEGCSRKGASFCWPIEQAHGTFKALLDLKPDIIFLPHVKALPVPGGEDVRVACPFVQSEPYILKAAFPETSDITVLTPVLDMSIGYDQAETVFVEIARKLGHSRSDAQKAFVAGLEAQNKFHRALQQAGKKVLEAVDQSEDTAVVLFGRPYNAFSSLGNMGIPKKLASRGYRVILQDFLPLENEDTHDNMYWASGQWIMKAARFVARHDKLYGAYITNFSCGPDSFLIGYFRNIMGRKPSLTLELDSHTADAGVDTRIEAFLDVVRRYRDMEKLGASGLPLRVAKEFRTAMVENVRNKAHVVTSTGERYPLSHPKVKVLIPSMGEIASKMLAATLRYVGANTVALPPPGEKELTLGRGYASCKECLPLVLTCGSLMRYIQEEWNGEDILVNFMPETSGPCRFGQYNVMMRELVAKQKLDKVAMLSLTSENSYAGFGVKFALRAWQSVILSDVLDDIHSAIIALAAEPALAERGFNAIADTLINSIGSDPWPVLRKKIEAASKALSLIPRKGELEDIPTIGLIGEIYVRRDEFSRQFLVERLSKKGFWVRTSPVAEWIRYCDYIVQNRLVVKSKLSDRIKNRLTCMVKDPYEKEIKSIFANCGFYRMGENNVAHLVDAASNLVSPRLTGETVLTVGAALADLVEEVEGIISLGPFGCMPARISEALVTQKLAETKTQVAREADLVAQVMEAHPALPFLSVETDGNAFPQLIESRLEAFLLQVTRVFETKKNVISCQRDMSADRKM